jgi:hypothetical protein
MVVTASLARGLLRDTIRRESTRSHAAWDRLAHARARVPRTLRGFGAWFRLHEACFQGAAILIVHGMTARRTGTFSAYLPKFEETDLGWTLSVERLRIDVQPRRLLAWGVEDLPVTFCGHALERMFQRGNTHAWSAVRDALAEALVFAAVAVPQYLAGPYRQMPLATRGGLLAGVRDGDRVLVKTFLDETSLNTRRARLLTDFRELLATRSQAFDEATVCGNEPLSGAMARVLAKPVHAWLLEDYAPAEDPLAQAWASRPDLAEASR